MKITMITNSPVWSLGKYKGAPSFYNTIKLYAERGVKIDFFTTEADLELDEFDNIVIYTMPKVPLIQSQLLWGLPRLLNKHINYVFAQFIGLFFLLRHSRHTQCVYAYEIGFVPASRLFAKIRKIPFISRFQGTVLTDLVNPVSKRVKLKKCIQFLDQIWALRTRSDLLIMTNDGTKGEEVVDALTLSRRNVWFVRNGVDLPDVTELAKINDANNYVGKPSDVITFASASRVQQWKRLDRSLLIFAEIVKQRPNCHYIICGDGPALRSNKELAMELGIADKVTFMGAVDKTKIYSTLLQSTFFLSSYELSNLGNPLFEAISCGCVVVTLANGDTAQLVEHMHTGLIQEEQNYLDNAASILAIIDDLDTQSSIVAQAQTRLANNFCSWETRMENEYQIFSALH